MKQGPVKKNKQNFIGTRLRMYVMAWCMVVGCLMMFGFSFAWFTSVERKAESKVTSVMEPYYLTLLNPSETDILQLSVGSLMPGKTKQIVFCVSNKSNEENELINMGGADFDYSLELIHTDNLALNFSIYELEEAEASNGNIVAEDVVIAEDGTTTTEYTYWNVVSDALRWTNVSDARHEQVELSGVEINRGTYISYEGSNFHLTDGGEGYDAQYFLLEIDWKQDAISNFEQYDKETDMIYILVKALLPEPEKG